MNVEKVTWTKKVACTCGGSSACEGCQGTGHKVITQTKYRTRIRRKGKRVYSPLMRRRQDALEWGRVQEAAIDLGQVGAHTAGRVRTVGDLIDRYVERVLRKNDLKDAERREAQLHWWADYFGEHLKLSEVTRRLIAEGRDALAEGEGPSGRPASPATQNRYLGALSHVFTIAVKEWEWADSNPVSNVQRRKEPKGRVRFLSDDERARLLAACEARDDRLHFLVLMALATGARQGELLALRWRDVDFQGEIATLRDTKNGDERVVPVTGTALVEARRRRRVRRIDTDLVFVGDRGKASFPNELWGRAVRDAGLEDFRFHDLRHTTASYLVMSGCDLRTLAEILGHKTLAMVQRYSHLSNRHIVDAATRMTDRFLA